MTTTFGYPDIVYYLLTALMLLGFVSFPIGLLLSFLVFIKIKYNKINVAEQDKKLKRNFRISNIISFLIIGAVIFTIVLAASFS
jgi:ethanolamine transporter EutH